MGAICCIDYLADWERLGSRKSTGKEGAMWHRIFIGRLEKMIPGIQPEPLNTMRLELPATVKRYTLNPGGAVYGFAQTPSRKGVDCT
ncbi:MAG: hypothetical protein MZV63_67325 [Marinilabiliales bacterium]|nr:hypothetical protein [Marinilabiliales bacterium]